MSKQVEKTISQIVEERFGKEKMAQLQAQYNGRQLNIIIVEDKVAVLAPLTPKVLSGYTRMVMDPNGGVDAAAKFLIDTLWLGGDDVIRDDDDYFMSAMVEIQNLMELKKSSSGKY